MTLLSSVVRRPLLANLARDHINRITHAFPVALADEDVENDAGANGR
jgi:hypothetical protein